MLSGAFPSAVDSDETEWELRDCTQGVAGRELCISLLKAEKRKPFWPCLVKAGPEVDVSRLKREEQSLEEIMSELKASEAMAGMERAKELSKGL
mgnify:CR=1 FL=1